MGLFGSNPLKKIEDKDEKVDEKLERCIKSIHSSIKTFKRILSLKDANQKDEEINDLHDLLTRLLQEILLLIEDEKKIETVETLDAKYNISQDDALLSDKVQQLTEMKNITESLVELLDENPNLAEYADEYLETVVQELTEVEDAFKKIIEDDKKLESLYKSLS